MVTIIGVSNLIPRQAATCTHYSHTYAPYTHRTCVCNTVEPLLTATSRVAIPLTQPVVEVPIKVTITHILENL